MPRLPTLEHRFLIARRLAGVDVRAWARGIGVSHVTVYRALHDKPEIADETRDRILRAVERFTAKHLGHAA